MSFVLYIHSKLKLRLLFKMVSQYGRFVNDPKLTTYNRAAEFAPRQGRSVCSIDFFNGECSEEPYQSGKVSLFVKP